MLTTMARPRSEDKRDALMAAATPAAAAPGLRRPAPGTPAGAAAPGLAAPTAVIAREAGVSNGSLFTYFETKADLFSRLYLELKTGMAAASLEGLPAKAPLHEQFSHMWSNWMRWAVANPGKRRALALLSVSDDVAQESREAAHQAMADVAGMLE